jgi:hypothetical protein
VGNASLPISTIAGTSRMLMTAGFKINGCLYRAIGAIFASVVMSSDVGAAIFTPGGVFADCTDAVEFRDGPLFRTLNSKFDNYDTFKEEVYATFLEKYQKERERLLGLLPQIRNEKKKIVYVALVQLGLSFFVEEYTKKEIGSLSLPRTDRQILEAVMNNSNGLKIDLTASMIKGEIDPQGIAISQVKALADLIAAAANKGLAPPPIVLAGRVYTTGSILIPATADWLDKNHEQRNIQQLVSMSFEATQRIVGKSNKVAVDDLNKVKGSIDNQCSKK